jgi:MFS family permease
MALSSEYRSSLESVSHVPDAGKETFVDEKGSSPNVERPSPALPTAVDQAPLGIEITYPEGGRDAWLVVLGAFCGLTASLGIYNAAGVFEVVISKVILPEESPSTLGWIFSTYAFVNWVCGVQIGPTFDAMGPRGLIIAGSICTLVGIFWLSVCTGKISFHMILHASPVLVIIC